MALPLAYNIRNLMARKTATILTALGMALVVFVFASTTMLAKGLRQTLVDTGSARNVVVTRKGATSEVDSAVDRAQAMIVESLPSVAKASGGGPLAAREILVLVTMTKRAGGVSNVAVRGVMEQSFLLRPGIRVVQGRMPRFGLREVVVGKNLVVRFKGLMPGSWVRLGLDEYLVVGIMDAGQTAFSSEIWADADQVMQTFRRPVYSSLVFRLASMDGFDEVKRAVDADPRLQLKAKRERDYWRDQSEMMAVFLEVVGVSLSLIFSIGAVIGAMVTMHANVAGRTSEIGTLRALGFGRRHILAGFLAESGMLGVLGGVLGLGFASFLPFVSVSTLNFQTFSEITFRFVLDGEVIAASMAFAVGMGIAGGIVPALKASRMNIVEALRTA